MSHIVFDLHGTIALEDGAGYKFCDGMEDVIGELGKKHDLYIWTSFGQNQTMSVLTELEIIMSFNDIKTADDTTRKPDPAGIIEMVGKFDHKDCLVIGDSRGDMIGAKQFGAHTIGATWYNKYGADELTESGADFICEVPSEVLSIVKEIFGE